MTGPSKAEIWQADFGGSVGHEQKKQRPCVIWRDLDHLNMAIVIPFTSREKEDFPHTHEVLPDSENGLEKESIALVFQIKAIDKKRLKKKLGVLGQKDVHSLGTLLKDLLRI